MRSQRDGGFSCSAAFHKVNVRYVLGIPLATRQNVNNTYKYKTFGQRVRAAAHVSHFARHRAISWGSDNHMLGDKHAGLRLSVLFTF